MIDDEITVWFGVLGEKRVLFKARRGEFADALGPGLVVPAWIRVIPLDANTLLEARSIEVCFDWLDPRTWWALAQTAASRGKRGLTWLVKQPFRD